MQQNQCRPSTANGHIAALQRHRQWHYFRSFSFFLPIFFISVRPRRSLARLSPRFQWFLFVPLLIVGLSKKWYFRKHLAQYCFSRTPLHRVVVGGQSRGGGVIRPKCACVSNTEWREEIYFIYFLSMPYAFLNTQMHFRPMGTKTPSTNSTNQPKKSRGKNERVFAYGVCVCGWRSRLLFASLHSIIFSKSFFSHILVHHDSLTRQYISRCLREVCSSLLHSILSVIAKFNIKNIFIFVSLGSLHLKWWKWNCCESPWQSQAHHLRTLTRILTFHMHIDPHQKRVAEQNHSIKMKIVKNARNGDIDNNK